MIYPKFLEKNDIIGITAPSAGIGEEKVNAFNVSMHNLEKAGFRIVETKSVRNGGIVSASGENRAFELMHLFLDENIKMVMCASGGDFLIDMLPYVDFTELTKNPKWLQGSSDPTSLLYAITTNYDIATIYGPCAVNFDMSDLHSSLINSIEIIKGNIVIQNSFDMYESEKNKTIDGYNLTNNVEWKNLNGDFNITGRLIGGCMDCLLDIIGTPYDGTLKFIEKYKEDGIIWYFDIFALKSEDVYRTLWHMKEAGWFKYSRGFIFGRVRYMETLLNVTYEEAIVKALGNMPIVFNADIGHVNPKMTFINGAIIEIKSFDSKGIVEFKLI